MNTELLSKALVQSRGHSMLAPLGASYDEMSRRHYSPLPKAKSKPIASNRLIEKVGEASDEELSQWKVS